jgi:hypothetical protein
MFYPTDIITLTPQIIFEGGLGVFTCSSLPGTAEWFVNGSLLVAGNGTIVEEAMAGSVLTFLNTPVQYSGTTVQCMVMFSDGSPPQQSNTATLLVQGMTIIA